VHALGTWAFWHGSLDVLSVLATVAAAVLAAVAIRTGNAQSERSMKAIQDERRIDFELDQLLSLLRTVDQGLAPHWRGQAQFLLQLLPDDDPNLAYVRAIVLEEDNPARPTRLALRAAEQERYRGQGPDGIMLDDVVVPVEPSYRDRMRNEVRLAVAQRLTLRAGVGA
jgi:hypothetical protein